MILKVFGLLFLFGSVAAKDEDPKIYKVEDLTQDSGTTNRNPVFSYDGRLVYFEGFGPTYGTKCPHVYQLDLSTGDISLFSTGLGRETHMTLEYDQSSTYNIDAKVVISSANYAFYSFAKGDLGSAYFKNDDLCPPGPCDADADMHFDECKQPHSERFDSEGIFQIDENGKVRMIELRSEEAVNYDLTPAAVITPCLNVPIYTKGRKSFSLCTAIGDNGEEAIYKVDKDDNGTALTGFASGAFDGFQRILDKKTNKNGQFFFHGYQLTDPTNAEQKKKIAAIKAGVIPREGSVIFQGSVDGVLGSTKTWPTKLTGLESNKDYVFPFAGPDSTQAIVTGYDQTTKLGALYSVKVGSTDPPVLLTNSTYNSESGTLDFSGKYIVFSSDRKNNGDQLYRGIYDKNAPKQSFKQNKPKKIRSTFSNYFLHLKNYYYNPSNAARLFDFPSVSDSTGMIMYISNDDNDADMYCPQIYQIDPDWDDTTVRRKMSSGIHAYNSPNFLDNGNILYAATLTKDYIDIEVREGYRPNYNLCRIQVCVEGSPGYDTVKDICKNVMFEKTLSSYSDLYISNQFGSIKQRVTRYPVYNGDAVVRGSADVVYTSYDVTNKDYNLYKIRLTDSIPEKNRKRLIDTYGYEGATTYNPNGNLIAYEAYRPNTDEEKKLYADRLGAGFTDLSKTEIYVYHFDSNKEYQISNYGASAYSPTFIDSNRVVFLNSPYTRGYKVNLVVAELKCDTTGCTINGPSILEYYNKEVVNIFYQPDLKSMVVATRDGVYLSSNVLTDKMVVSNPTTTVKHIQTTTQPTTDKMIVSSSTTVKHIQTNTQPTTDKMVVSNPTTTVKSIQTTTQLTTDTTDGGNVFGSSALTMIFAFFVVFFM